MVRFFQSFAASSQTASVPEESFEACSRGVREEEKMAGKGVLAALRAYQSCLALEALAHIVGARAKKTRLAGLAAITGLFFGSARNLGGKERS